MDGEAVSLWGKPEKEPAAELCSYRLPRWLAEYVKTTAKAQGRTMTDVASQAIEADAVLSDVLGAHRERLEAYAVKQGKPMSPRVLAALVLRGLDAEGL